MPRPYCINTYWAKYGFADFLRGTIALFYFCKKYNYDLYIDTSSSKIFSYLNPDIKYILPPHMKNDYFKNVEFYKFNNPGLSYPEIYINLENTFKNGKSFVVSTNSMYKLNDDGIPVYWGEITQDCKEFMQNILQTGPVLNNHIQNIFTSIYNFKENEPFKVIHIRCGDNYKKEYINEYTNFHNKICKYMEKDKDIKYVLVCDNIYLGINLNKNIPELKYWENIKGHTGKGNQENMDDALVNALCDYFIMSKACELLQFGPCGSGFSLSTSLIFGSNLKKLQNI